jgi:hypothetical protein
MLHYMADRQCCVHVCSVCAGVGAPLEALSAGILDPLENNSMNVTELENCGKDILSMQSQMSLREGLMLLGPVSGYLGSILKVLGPGGTVRLVKGVKEEIQQADTRDWAGLKVKRGS